MSAIFLHLSLAAVGLFMLTPRPSPAHAPARVPASKVACSGPSPGEEPGPPAWMLELEERIPRWMDRADVPGLTMLVIARGRVAWTASFGVSDRASGRTMTRDALFRVESISKPVTAWGVMKLVEEGRLALDSPVAASLSSWAPPPGTPPFTVRQLLSHTAGVGLGDYGDRHPPDADVPDVRESLHREFRLDAAPGSRFSYSDTGYNLLEVLVEDVTGQPFGTWMTRAILHPLGMCEASYDWSPAFSDRLATGYTLHGEPVPPYVYPGRGSGGLFATIDDVARFVQAGMARRYRSGPFVLSESGVDALHDPVAKPRGLYGLVADGYSLGHFTETLDNGHRSVWHGGQGYGWMTHAQWIPATGDGIILLANSQRAWPLFGHVLRSWSEALGVAPVGMSRVTHARPVAVALVIGLLLGAALQAIRLLSGVIAGTRRRAPLTGLHPVRRSVQAGLGLILFSAVAWAAFQEYLFVFSILPGMTVWLGVALIVAGSVLVATALLPVRERPGA